jgi:hypothetical protein
MAAIAFDKKSQCTANLDFPVKGNFECDIKQLLSLLCVTESHTHGCNEYMTAWVIVIGNSFTLRSQVEHQEVVAIWVYYIKWPHVHLWSECGSRLIPLISIGQEVCSAQNSFPQKRLLCRRAHKKKPRERGAAMKKCECAPQSAVCPCPPPCCVLREPPPSHTSNSQSLCWEGENKPQKEFIHPALSARA